MIVSFDQFVKQAGGTAKDVQVIGAEQETEKQGAFAGLGTSLKETAQKRLSAISDIATSEAPLPKKIVMGLGEVAGGITEGVVKTGMAGVSAAIPDDVEAKAKESGLALLQTPFGQKALKAIQGGAETYAEAKKTNPDAFELLESVVDIASLYPIAKTGVGVVKKGEELAQAGVRGVKTTVKTIKDLGSKITPDAAGIMQRVARVSKGKQIAFEKMAGESIGSYLDRRGIYGGIDDISDGLYKRFSVSKNAADDAFARLQGKYKNITVGQALKGLLEREGKVSVPGARSSDYYAIKDLVSKYNKEGLTMSEINAVKRLYERNVRLDFIKQNLPESVARATNIDNALRTWQFEQAAKLGLKNIKHLNKETQLAKQLLDNIGKEYAGSAGNNMVTLTDWIMLSGGDPTAIAAFLVKKGMSMKEAQSWIAKHISTSQKIPMPKAEFGAPKKGFSDLGE